MIDKERFPLLSNIDQPDQLRQLPETELQSFCDELRDFLIHSVSRSGGHFGAGLGCVELTAALHYVYNTPHDRIIWDVGHQAYPHKIITGRRDLIESIKKKNGLTPFPKRSESEHDAFGVGHSSTSISAALGMALASKLQKKNRKVVAVIGDGAMTAGMAYEALNHGGDTNSDILVVLNENQMSISPNVGSLMRMLARIAAGDFYTGVRESSKRLMKRNNPIRRFLSRWEEHAKGMFLPSTLFEELGFHYVGPVDGHDVDLLVKTIRTLHDIKGPQFLHITTSKGKGYAPAEKDPIKYHAVSPFNPKQGITDSPGSKVPTYTQVFSKWICDMGKQDSRLVAITPAMREGSGLVQFSKDFPERYIDVGIAEQHAVTLAAGMACEESKPVVAIYSTFLQRAYDQTIHDVDIQNLDVLFAIDRAGLVGPDGATHAGSFDISYLRCLPNMIIMAPSDENECRQMLSTGYHHPGPAAVRYPRETGLGIPVQLELTEIAIGKAKQVRTGNTIALLSFGTMLSAAVQVGDELNASIVDMRFIKPLDEAMILRIAQTHQYLVTLEENALPGGAGSGVNDLLLANDCKVSVLNLGLPNRYLDHGNRHECLSEAGLCASGILKSIRHRWQLSQCQLQP